MKFYDENGLINLNPRLFTKRSNFIKGRSNYGWKKPKQTNSTGPSKKHCFFTFSYIHAFRELI